MGGYYQYQRLSAAEINKKKKRYNSAAMHMATMNQISISNRDAMEAVHMTNRACQDALSMHMYGVTGMF